VKFTGPKDLQASGTFHGRAACHHHHGQEVNTMPEQSFRLLDAGAAYSFSISGKLSNGAGAPDDLTQPRMRLVDWLDRNSNNATLSGVDLTRKLHFDRGGTKTSVEVHWVISGHVPTTDPTIFDFLAGLALHMMQTLDVQQCEIVYPGEKVPQFAVLPVAQEELVPAEV
jgi:hypothetical protein